MISDPNLQKIKDANMHLITRGRVREAIFQAEDYLVHMIGFDNERVERELNAFISDIKEERRNSRGQK